MDVLKQACMCAYTENGAAKACVVPSPLSCSMAHLCENFPACGIHRWGSCSQLHERQLMTGTSRMSPCSLSRAATSASVLHTSCLDFIG